MGAQGKKPGPRNDRFHDHNGDHRSEPPPGENPAVWESDKRKHLERHATIVRAAAIAPDLGIQVPRVDIELGAFLIGRESPLRRRKS